MTNKIAWAAALMLSTAFAAHAQTPDAMPGKSAPMATSKTADLSKSDKAFIDKAASGGMAEVQAAQLAEQKSQDPKVKEFAEKMVTDHTANNKQLASLAEQKGVEVPTALDAKDQKEMDKLSALDGAKFDKAYMKAQVKGHESMLKLMQREAKSGKDSDLKSFASGTAPTVQDHLTMAKADSQS